MRNVVGLGVVITLLVAISACSSEDTDSGPPAADGGSTADTGTDSDGGNTTADAGSDAGTTPSCNPIDGTGCTEADNFCVLEPVSDQGQCGTLPATRRQHEQTCSDTDQDCEPGYVCIGFTGEPARTCRKVCSQMTGMGCEGLTGTSTTGYGCLIALTGSTRYAMCTPRPPPPRPRDPLASVCNASQNCTIVDNDGTTGCVPNGSVGLNMSCGSATCTRPGICAALNSMPALCYEPCDKTTPSCSTATYVCLTVTFNGTDAPFGLCGPP